MASKFKVGDLVWAKMKGFCAWPAKIIEPMSEVKRPTSKKTHHFVFFFGSENYAWVQEDSIYNYQDNKSKYTLTSRIPRGYNVAIEAIEDVIKAMPSQVPVKTSDLPTIDEELAQIFPNRSSSSGPHKDYTREPLSGKKIAKKKILSNSIKKYVSLASNGKDSSKVDKVMHRDKHESSASQFKKKSVARINIRNSRSDNVRLQAKEKSKSPDKETKDESSPLKPSLKRLSSSNYAPKNKKSKMVVRVAAPQTKTDIPSRKSVSKKANLSLNRKNSPLKPKAHQNSIKLTENNVYESAQLPVKSVSSATQIEETLLSRSISSVNTNVYPTKLKIGFLGLGIMGQGMVMNLIRSGHEVTVWNRTSTKCRDFIKEGALKKNTPADVVHACDITISCISDTAAVKDVVFGNCGVIQGISSGKGYVEMSTIDEETIKDVREAVVLRGGRFLEAPVCGSRVPALEGQLVILASGDRKLYEDCHSSFEAMGKRSFFLGETGMATRMKLVVNMMLGSMMASLAETMALAQKAGLEQEDVATILSLGPLASTTVCYKSQAIMNNKHDPHFPLQHQQKDLRLALDLGDRVEQPLYVAAAANELYKKARRLGYGESDISAVYRATSA
ncbi:putative oxidoreductase GLYR1 isoform X1 [Octopus sinensis]|uniref:Cytokine-like nuclear factor N-PAC n=1 Tax=Octopus sinensis TaxID=2607531 RepID=A0A6P7TEE4_9MOLL|nr:putative oxidoreductase GLYR1 isoform X1 [Octopus sinensis]